jgi:hypothetical protein
MNYFEEIFQKESNIYCIPININYIQVFVVAILNSKISIQNFIILEFFTFV